MKKTILFLLISIGVLNTYSQNELVYIHKSVGNQIDKTEKNKYFLFPALNDSLFLSTYYIKFNDSTFIAYNTFANDSINKQQIAFIEFQEIKDFITKFDEYYTYQQQKDSLFKREMDSVLIQSIPRYQSIENLNKQLNSKEYSRTKKSNYYNSEYKKSIKSSELDKKNGHRAPFIPSL